MDCPRCGGSLATFAVEATGKSAVSCESCGFAGVAASHEPEESDVESWARAIERFEAAGVSLDRSRQARRADAVSVPTDETGSGVDAGVLEESVTVAAALGEDDAPDSTGAGGSDRDTGGSDRDTGGTDRDTGGSDRDTGGTDRDTGGSERDTGGSDRDTGGSDADETPKENGERSDP